MDNNANPPKGLKIFSSLHTICPPLAMVMIAILFSGIYDLGIIDLRGHVSAFAGPALVILLVCVLLSFVSASRLATHDSTAREEQSKQVLDQVEVRIAAVEEKAASFLSQEYERVKAENEEFKAEFKEIEARERENIQKEIEALRLKNSELQERLSLQSKQEVDVMIPEADEPVPGEQAA